jgi:hypothetical protein
MRALAVIVLVGCTGVPRAAPVTRRATPLTGAMLAVPGETMEFEVKLRGIRVGLVQTAVGWPGVVDDHRAVIVRSRGKTDGLLGLLGDLTWELSSTVDVESGVPIEDHEQAWADFAGDKEHHESHHRWDDGEHRHDIHTAVTAIRGWRSSPGARTELEVEVGGGRFDVSMWHVGRAMAVHQPAIRYDGIAADQFPFSAWVSDDTSRVPLRFVVQTKLGEISVELVDYQIPSDR